MDKMKKNSCFKLFSATFMLLCILLVTPFLSAFEFDNVKSFDKNVGKYGKVTIENAFGLGEILEEIELKENTFICFDDCRAEKEITIYNDGALIDDIRFMKDDKGKWKQDNVKSYNFYIQTEEEVITGNGTRVTNKVLTPYNLGDEVKAGTYTVILKGIKNNLKETIDWQITSQGRLIEEYAVWGYTEDIYASWTTQSSQAEVSNLEWKAQTFKVGHTGNNAPMNVSIVSVYAYRDPANPNPQILTTRIYAVDVDNKPTGSALSYNSTNANAWATSIAWHNLTMISGSTLLQNDTNYTIVQNATGVRVLWGDDGVYPYGIAFGSVDSGASWSEFGGGQFTFYVWGEKEREVILNAPADDSYSSTNVQFNCSVNITGSGATLNNMSLWHNGTGTWHNNQTNITIAGDTQSTVIFTSPFSDGAYEWTCQACDSDHDCNFASTNRTVIVDATAPSVSITAPSSSIDYGYSPMDLYLNWTVSDANLNSCWYQYNNTNFTVACLDLNTTFATQVGNQTITLYANDSVNNVNSDSVTWIYKIFKTAESYPSPIPEGSTQTFKINVTSPQASVTPYLVYNGTSYLGSVTKNGNDYYSSRVLDIPPVNADTDVSFFWRFLLADSSWVNGTENNVTVINFAMDNCTSNNVTILNFLLRQESNNTFLNNETNNIEAEVDIYSLDDVLIGEYNRTWTGEYNVSICVGNITNADYYLYLTTGFSSTGYVNEFWYIDRKVINETSVPITVNLMDLETADSTSFLFNFFDENGLTVTDPIIKVWRKYIGEGIFREVERSKQNEDGDTIVHLVEEDVIYYFQVSQNGEVIFTSSTYSALCDTTPCTITLEASGGFQDFDNDWDLVDNGAYTVSADPITRTVNLTFTTTTPSTFNLTVYRLDSSGQYEAIDSGETTGLTGDIGLTIPSSTGNYSFFGVVKQDGSFVTSRWIDFEGDSSVFFGTTFSIFLAILIVMCLGLMAISEGSGTIVFIILGLVLSVILGLVDFGTSLGFNLITYFVLTGGIIIYKLTRRNR